MTDRILVTGATGNTGSALVEKLSGSADFVAAVRDVDRARARFDADVPLVRFDFTEPETFTTAFAGIDRLFLVRPPQIADVPGVIGPVIQAASEQGVRYVVFLSLMGVERNRVVPHYKIEQLLRESGMDWTFLRAGFFMQNFDTTHREEIRDRHEIDVPVGRSRTSFIDVRDIAAVAACALSQPGHENQAYTLTGSESLDYFQVAEIFSEVLRRDIRYRNPTIPGFVLRHLRRGTPPGFTLIMTMLYTLTRMGTAEAVTDTVHEVTGNAPITLRQYIQDYQACWR